MDKFCINCGTERVKKPTGLFNGSTGKPTTYLACPNVTKCTSACREDGGHHYKGFWDPVCIRCGYPEPACDY